MQKMQTFLPAKVTCLLIFVLAGKVESCRTKDTLLLKANRFDSLKNRFHSFHESLSMMLSLSIHFDLTECTQRVRNLFFRNANRFVISNTWIFHFTKFALSLAALSYDSVILLLALISLT